MMLAAGLGQRTPLVIAAVAFLLMLILTIALILPDDQSPDAVPSSEEAVPSGGSAVKPRASQLPVRIPEATAPDQNPAPSAVSGEGEVKPGAATATAAAGQPKPPVETSQVAAGKEPAAEAEEKTGAEVGPNAADLYREAFAQMQLGDTKAMRKIEKIAEAGWSAGDRALEDLLAANQPAFELFRKGVACPRCRFIDTHVATGDEPLPHLDQAASLAYLVTAEARMLVTRGEDVDAMQRCVEVTKLADDLRGDRAVPPLKSSHALLTTVFPTFVTLLQKGKLDEASLQTALAGLRKSNTQATQLGDYLTGDVASIRHHVRASLQDEAYLANKAWRPPLTKDVKDLLLEVPVAQRLQFVRDALAAFDDRCVRVLSAVQSGRHADMTQLAAELSKIRLKAKTPGFGRKPKEAADYLAARLMPRLEPLWKEHLADQLKRRVLLCLAALRVSRARNATWPSSLQDLVPDSMEAVPKDPLDPAEGELRYRAVGVEAAIWSVGDDGKDDAPASVSKVGVPGKDVVYWLQ